MKRLGVVALGLIGCAAFSLLLFLATIGAGAMAIYPHMQCTLAQEASNGD